MSTHDHVHEEDSYYLDQLCMVTISAAFGGICLALYFWKTTMLNDMLGQQFHKFVLLSGLALVILALVRAANLWIQVGQEKAHVHEHSGEHETMNHAEEHDCCHDHEHAPGHHHHDHEAADHDHSWAPWRYVVLLVPVVLFMLGLPRKGKEVESVKAEFTMDVVAEAVGLIAPGSLGWSQLVYAGYLGKDQVGGNYEDWDFKKMEESVRKAASSPDANARSQWKDSAIRAIGKFAPSRESEREFRLVRYKITCCAPDAVSLSLPIISRENITNIKPDTWVQVTGRIEFRKRREDWVAVIVVSGKDAVVPCPPDPNPYIQ